MRLIDADKLIQTIEKNQCTDCDSYHGVRCRACNFMDSMDYIEDQPTAYDVGKVVEQLKENSDTIHATEYACHFSKDVCGKEFIETEDAIKIVKVYGKESEKE